MRLGEPHGDRKVGRRGAIPLAPTIPLSAALFAGTREPPCAPADGCGGAGPASRAGLIVLLAPYPPLIPTVSLHASHPVAVGVLASVAWATPPRSVDAPFVELHDRHGTAVLPMSNGAPPAASGTT
jgi:hypothetical protein